MTSTFVRIGLAFIAAWAMTIVTGWPLFFNFIALLFFFWLSEYLYPPRRTDSKYTNE